MVNRVPYFYGRSVLSSLEEPHINNFIMRNDMPTGKPRMDEGAAIGGLPARVDDAPRNSIKVMGFRVPTFRLFLATATLITAASYGSNYFYAVLTGNAKMNPDLQSVADMGLLLQRVPVESITNPFIMASLAGLVTTGGLIYMVMRAFKRNPQSRGGSNDFTRDTKDLDLD
jgi:hypothetical protein